MKGRATARSRLTTWLRRRLDGASCHRWPVTGDALGARQSARGMEGCSGGGRGMQPRRALTWRRHLCGGGARLQCSGEGGRCGAFRLSLVLLQNGGKRSRGVRPGVTTWRREKTGGPGVSGARSDGHSDRSDSGGRGRLPVTWNRGRGGRGWLACGLARGWGLVTTRGATVKSGARDGN
jgi:hypothetical protein